ncbi:hypothetical protein A7D00_7295 [Trichophyton violaceum]|uniref:Protein phosphatase n=1 Tax=Trichophyton violaceum TaxID=34388 RepID=A0A178FA06_TRIVO|nr:hypothetical protein A7D00_7295 [Trichophyton violaceum]
MVFTTPAFTRFLISSNWKLPTLRQFIQWSPAVAPISGISTPTAERNVQPVRSKWPPFYFDTGYSIIPKRPSRPFPPPFLSPPSTSFSDALTTHDKSHDRRPSVNGEPLRGLTNGDDAILCSPNFLGVNDGVGAWASKPQGHAALWSRLILHYWALEVENRLTGSPKPDLIECLQRAYEETVEATSSPNEILGTTTTATALLSYKIIGETPTPFLHVTNLGDCQTLVIRPRERRIVFKTDGQWHWFDCPMQLGTNSVDKPRENAALSVLEIEENDIVIVVSDGVTDNLWDHDVLEVVLKSLEKWEICKKKRETAEYLESRGGRMVYVAEQLLTTARAVALDPAAQTPYMEKAQEVGLSVNGGKMDDISVVAGRVVRSG